MIICDTKVIYYFDLDKFAEQIQQKSDRKTAVFWKKDSFFDFDIGC
jgi:hypothetical protein